MSSEVLPRLRHNLRYIPQVQDGKSVYVVKDPVSLKYFRFGEMEGWMMQRMDGTRSFAQIAAELSDRIGKAVSAAAIEPFYRRLRELGIAERTQAERSVLLLEKMREQRKLRLKGHGNTLLRMRFSIGDPDELFNRVVPRIGFFWTPTFVVVSAIAFLVYALILATHWGAFTAGVARLYQPSQYTLGFIVTLYLTVLVIIAIHELGHGLTCKRFGGEVHEIGAMLLYFSPAFFCNVNDAWTFEKKSHRLWVTFAGGWIQLLIAAIAGVVWILVEPASFLHQLAFVAMLFGGGLALVLNFNPLIPLDGYYALMDWLEIPNLRARSFEYLRAYLRRNLLGMDLPLPPVTPREKKIFLIYGSLAFLYTFFLLGMIGFWVGGLLVRRFEAWGWAIVLLAVAFLGRKAFRQGAHWLHVWASERLPGPRARKIAAAAATGVAALVLLAALLPWTVRVPGVALVEPAVRTWLRPADEGWIEAIPVAEGALVQAGDPVVVLRNPELELEWTHARAAVEALEREAAAARARGNPAQASQIEVQLAARQTRFAEMDRRRDALVLRAPFAAQVVTPHLEEWIGARALKGDSLVELWSSGPLHARVLLAERDVGEIRAGSPVGLKFPVRASWTWRTHVQSIGPAARQGQIELLAPLAMQNLQTTDPEHPLRPGMVGEAKVAVEHTSVAGALLRWLRHTIRTDWLL
jgi:multidrug efflux pump subunit AcrA (membrane-fusion protein)